MKKTDDVKIDFIGIGAQKAATSWIFKCLLEHPDICGFAGKESHFFSQDKEYDKGLGYYFSFFSHCKPGIVKGEFSTSYLSSSKAVDRIKRHLPKVKIIVCLRNPLERAVSHINHLCSKGALSGDFDLAEAIDRFPQIIENGLYAKHLKIFLDNFDRRKIKILFYEDISKDPAGFIKEIYDFLKVDTKFIPKGVSQKYHTSRARSNNWYKKVNRFYLFLNNHKAGRILLQVLRRLGVNSYRLNTVLEKGKKQPIFFPDEREKKRLADIFRPDVEELERIINKDLSLWKTAGNN